MRYFADKNGMSQISTLIVIITSFFKILVVASEDMDIIKR